MNIAVNKIKTGIKKEKNKKKNAYNIWSGVIISAFLAAVIVFVTMVQMEKKMLAPYEKSNVYVVIQPIPKGVTLTQKEMMNYVEATEWDKSNIPNSAITDLTWLEQKKALISIDRGILLTHGMFGDFKEVAEKMKEPVIAGFKADDLSQVAGGILREGDSIHIYCKKEDAIEIVRENAVIQRVFDQNGNTISNEDQNSAVQRINIYLDKKEVEQFYQKIGDGSIRVVKADNF